MKTVKQNKKPQTSIISKILGVNIQVAKNPYGIGYYAKKLFAGFINIFKRKAKAPKPPTTFRGQPIDRVKYLIAFNGGMSLLLRSGC